MSPIPVYLHVCATCGERQEVWRSIHAATVRGIDCPCGGRAVLTMTSPAIAADALPNKKHGVRAINNREKQWDRDLPAYARMRRNGVQPRGIDGAAEVEARAGTVTEVEMGHRLIDVAKRRGKAIHPSEIRRAQEVSAELLGNDVTKTGKEIGAAKRQQAGVA